MWHVGSRVGLSSCSSQALQHGLKGCGVQTWLPCYMWDLPGSGIEPMSPALAGGFFTTEPPRNPSSVILNIQRNFKEILFLENAIDLSDVNPDQSESPPQLPEGSAPPFIHCIIHSTDICGVPTTQALARYWGHSSGESGQWMGEVWNSVRDC